MIQISRRLNPYDFKQPHSVLRRRAKTVHTNNNSVLPVLNCKKISILQRNKCDLCRNFIKDPLDRTTFLLCNHQLHLQCSLGFQGCKICWRGECAICLQQLKMVSCEQLSCGHRFHKQCMQSWTLRSRSCPYCRRKVR